MNCQLCDLDVKEELATKIIYVAELGLEYNLCKAHAEEVEKQFAQKKVGRNDPCPCNSGKKFKKCHGRNV